MENILLDLGMITHFLGRIRHKKRKEIKIARIRWIRFFILAFILSFWGVLLIWGITIQNLAIGLAMIGLGLTVVQIIVKNLGGFISVESTVNHGTTFSVYLPINLNKIDKSKVEIGMSNDK